MKRADLNLPMPNARYNSIFDTYHIESIHSFELENIMRPLYFMSLACLSLSAYAAQPEKPAKADAPPPPPMTADDSVDEPQVTIIKQTEQTVEEFRANGVLYMIKITPKNGAPYYLVDDRGDGMFARRDSLDSGLRVPRWIIKRF